MILLGGWIIWEGMSNDGTLPHQAYGNRRRFLNPILTEGMQKIYEKCIFFLGSLFFMPPIKPISECKIKPLDNVRLDALQFLQTNQYCSI